MISHRNQILLAMASVLVLPNYHVYASDADEQVETIVVTGSRIARSTAATAIPTTIIDSKQIEQLGLTNAGDILNTLPALADSVGRRNTNGDDANSGLELLNLRGLGTERTLVLVNGRRHVGSQAGSSAVDVSSIAAQMIDRVEVITGAASAVYGADAVSGVVNFVLKREFDGVKANVQYGQSAQSDGEEGIVSILAGTEFDDGKGNVLISLDYHQREQVRAEHRDYASKGLAWYDNELDTGPNDGIAAQRLATGNSFLPLNAGGIASTTGFGLIGFTDGGAPILGYMPIGDLGVLTFDETGQALPFESGNCQGIRCENGMGFTTHEYAVLSTPTERSLFSINANYQVADAHNLYFEGKYSYTTGENTAQPSFSDGVFGPIIQVGIDNPYLPDFVHDEMVKQEIPMLFVNKANADLGRLPTDNTFKLYTATFGSRGELSDDIGYEFYFQHGSSKTQHAKLDRLVANFVQAQDAILAPDGSIVCRDQSGGCAPLNPFGVNAASQAAIDFIMRPTVTDNKLSQTVANFTINGHVFEMPAGDVQFAAGVEYRRETSRSVPEAILLEGGLTNNTNDGPRQIVRGEYDVNEIYGELLVPLWSDLPYAQDVSFETALRYADYSTVGGQTSYKLGLNWTLNDAIRFRTSYGLAVRAANIGELFKPEELTYEFVTDPCDFRNIDKGVNPAKRKENCAALGVPEGFASLAEGASQKILVSGNPDLKPEESNSVTFGFVYTPELVPNLSLGIDYWKMEIEQAIATPNTNDILANCVDFDMSGNPFCELVTRRADSQLENISSKIINIAQLEATGYDLEANYVADVSGGNVLFNLVGSYYQNRDYLLNPDKPEDVIKQVGIANQPKLRLNLNTTYRSDNLTANLSLNYVGSSKIAYDQAGQDSDYPDNDIDSVWYANTRVSYLINQDMDVYLGVNNLFDKAPPYLPETTMGSNVYDGIGRSYYMGLNITF